MLPTLQQGDVDVKPLSYHVIEKNLWFGFFV